MKDYIGQIVDLTTDGYINPTPAIYDNGPHPRSVGQITSISIHHDAMSRPHSYDSVVRYKQEAAGHYNRLGPGLQYHFKIDNTGVIFATRPLDEWLYVVGSAENVSCIAICLDGYLHDDNTNQGQDPTREQYEALGQLLTYLCEQRPDVPATWPNVRPHCDYSSTACSGNRFYPWVFEINSKTDALNIPAGAVYDWPDAQSLPDPVPIPVPDVPPSITYEPINPAVYVSQVKTHLDDTQNASYRKDYEPNVEFTMVRRMTRGADKWLQTQYSVDKTPTRGIPEKDLVLKNQGTPPPASDPGSVPTPPVPETPPSPAPADQDHDLSHENNDLLKQILALVTNIWDALRSILKIGG